MASEIDFREAILNTWKTTNRATIFLIEHIPTDLWNEKVHFLAYFVAHEGHHRGQIILLARQLNHRFSTEVTNGVWQWTKRLKEAR